MKLDKAIDRLDVHASDLSGSVFNDVNISGASFEDVNMSGWIVNNANLAGLRLTNANLAGASISECRNVGTVLINGIAVSELFAAYEASKRRTVADA